MDALLKRVQTMAANAAAGGADEGHSHGDHPSQPQQQQRQASPTSGQTSQTPQGSQQQQQQQSRSISLKTATRDELVSFIKDYSAHTKLVEARCKELHDAHAAAAAERSALQAQYDALAQQNAAQGKALSAQLRDMEAVLARMTTGCTDLATALEAEALSEHAPKDTSEDASQDISEETSETPVLTRYAQLLRELANGQKAVPVPRAALRFYAPLFGAIDALRAANEANRSAVHDLQAYAASIPRPSSAATTEESSAKTESTTGTSEATESGLPTDIEVFRVREENGALRRARDALQAQVERMTAEAARAGERTHALEQQNAALVAAIEQRDADAAEQQALAPPPGADDGDAEDDKDAKTKEKKEDDATSKQTEEEEEKEKETSAARIAELERALEEAQAENGRLRARAGKLQQLLQKAKEQFDAKSRAALEGAAQAAKLAGEVAALRAAADDLHARLGAAADAREHADALVRSVRHDAVVAREALEARARRAEAELAQAQEQFRVYKERARAAIASGSGGGGGGAQGVATTDGDGTTTTSATGTTGATTYDAVDFLQLRAKNERLEQELAGARRRLAALEGEHAALREASGRRDAEHAAQVARLEEERDAQEAQGRRARAELETEYSLKYDELRAALREHREASTRALDGKDAEIATLRAQVARLSLQQTHQQQQQQLHTQKQQPQQQQQQQQPPQPPQPQQTLLHVANVQARRDEEVAELRGRVAALEDDNAELVKTVELHEIQERELKAQIRELDRSKSRETVNIEYLKNIVVKYVETDDFEHLMPVLSMLLRLTPEEVAHAEKARQVRTGQATAPRGLLSFFPSASSSPKK